MGLMLRTAMVLGLCWACVIRAAAAVPETPRFRIIGPAQGLPSTDIKALARDRTGYLWIATADGLARYDGIGMRVWRHDPANPQSLAGNNVQALHIDHRDRVWIAVEGGGISMLDAQRRTLRHYRKSEYPQIASDDTWAFASAGDSLWFGTYDGGLHRMDADGRITGYTFDEGSSGGLPSNTIMALAIDTHGVLWIGTDAGLARFDGDSVERIPLPGGEPAPLILSITREGDALWIGSTTGVLRREDGKWSRPPWSAMFERPNAMTAIAHDIDGSYWIASQGGLWRTHGDEPPTPVELGGPGIVKPIQTMLLQSDGALWVPVAGAGLGYLRSDWRRIAQYAQSPTGLAGELYRGLAPARRGGLWLGGYNGAIERLDARGNIERLDAAQRARMQGVKIVSIAEDDDGRLWVGHRTGLIRISREGTVDEWGDDDASDATPPGQIDQLRIAPDGNLWLSSQGGGIQQRNPATGKVLTEILAGESGGLGLADTEAMEFAPDGSLWIGSADGLSRLDPGRKRFRLVDAMRGGRVFAFAFDGNDALWLQRLSGLERYQRAGSGWRRATALTAAAGLPAVGAAGLRIDRRHRVWLSTARGLLRWDPRTQVLRRYGVQDGLDSQEFIDRAIALSDDGMLGAATADGGVLLVDTVAADPPAVLPALRMDSFAVRRDGRWQDTSLHSDHALPWREREFRIRARLLSFDDPLSNRYWSKLDGFDDAWNAQGDSGERAFAGLPPGDYTLRMRATDAVGNAAAEQSVRFRILPPWWRTQWALAWFALLALMTLTAAAWLYRQRLKRQHAWQLTEQMRELAEQASLAKTRFLATLGHEVRTPMTGVLGMSELLLGTALDARQRSYTESIRGAGNHLLRLVNDALDLARIESGKLELDVQPFALRTLVDDVTGLMAPLAARKDLQFEVSINTDAPIALHGDAMRIRQILLNLLGNAIKFTHQGSVGLRVFALAAQDLPAMESGGVRFEVGDTGPGLNDEQKARLFLRFEQAEGARTAARYGGSGLGLAISQELAAAMGGRIEVDSAPGQGTRFSVELPLATASITQAPSVAAPSSGAVRARDLLLVEDDPTVAEVIAGLLRAQGHRVTHVAHGLAALTETAGARFDAALLDLDLPGLDGLALARQLRAQGFSAPLLAVTARADAQAEPLAREAGFDGFLRKPVTGDMLAEALAALLPDGFHTADNP